jgi:hypothetical protein
VGVAGFVSRFGFLLGSSLMQQHNNPLKPYWIRLCGDFRKFLLLATFFGKTKKVGAAPHRGNANKPLTKQGNARASSPVSF